MWIGAEATVWIRGGTCAGTGLATDLDVAPRDAIGAGRDGAGWVGAAASLGATPGVDVTTLLKTITTATTTRVSQFSIGRLPLVAPHLKETD